MSTVLVWSDDAKLLGELAAKGSTLGTVKALDAAGLPDQDSATLAAALADAAKKSGAALVLVGHTKKGKDVGPRAAAHLEWPYASECQSIAAGWTVERMVL
jgi:electron transfer flavoprotein alpha subunit